MLPILRRTRDIPNAAPVSWRDCLSGDPPSGPTALHAARLAFSANWPQDFLGSNSSVRLQPNAGGRRLPIEACAAIAHPYLKVDARDGLTIAGDVVAGRLEEGDEEDEFGLP